MGCLVKEVNDHNTVILDEACEVRVCGAFSCSIQAVVREKREKGKERKKGKTQSKGERKKGEYVCCSESKKTKGEDEERRRREKTFLPELGFFFVSIVGFSFVVHR
ncbi:hypothetical protein DEO72_LG3g350 [Vigna unguiculata]|uniref:Transmembrane protein n=1 Tax=Vigna unguiculata TaxID=3917 RepID=A0A4D6LBC0_VIGUN|nr:hypothetical protein DEO72_LG3g350 [Vigna unguiculata]